MLPQASTAFQVLVNSLEQFVPEVTSETIFNVEDVHASDAVGAVKASEAKTVDVGQPSTEVFTPAAPMTGAVTSLTVIV